MTQHAEKNHAAACLFCGDTAEVVQTHNMHEYGVEVFVVQCDGCLCQGPSGDTAEFALKAWAERYTGMPKWIRDIEHRAPLM